MASYSVIIDKRVRKKDLPKIPKKVAAAIARRIAGLADNPYPADSVQLKGRQERRVRQGDYRILYVAQDETITVFVVQVGHRQDVYR